MSDTDTELSQQRKNLDLLLRAQRFGRTGYVISDTTLDRVYWSDSLFEQRKIPRRPWFTIAEGRVFIHPDDLPEFLRKREQSMRDGKEFQHETRILCGDGRVVWERGNSQPQYDSAGNFTGLLSVVEDITEEKNATASLLEQEATYRTLFDSIGDAIFLTQDGVFVDCNEASLHIFGATREQLIGQTPVRFSPALQPDGRASQTLAQEKIAAALRGERQTFEWRHRRHDGTEFDAEVVLSRVEGATENLFFGVVRDITERKRAELELRASYDKFAGAFSSTADAMIVMRLGENPGEGVFLDANAAAADLFGLPRRQMIGKTARETNLLTSNDSLLRFRGLMLGDGQVRGFRTTTRHTDGTTREVEISASLFGAPEDRLAILVVRDVTEQEAAAHKIIELNTSLEASVRQLRAIADNLPVGISHTDMDGRILFLNKTLEQWLALDLEKARGHTAGELLSADYMEATRTAREAFAAGASTVEQTIPLPDGITRTVSTTNIRDVDAAGTEHGNFGLIVDITEQKRAEAELRASHEKFASAFEYSADIIMVSTLGGALGEGVLVDLNRAAEKVFGRPRSELVGVKFAELMRDRGLTPLGERRRRLVQDGAFRDLPVEITNAAGALRHFLVSGARFNLGEQPHVLTVMRDVTEERDAAEKIRQLNLSLEKSLAQLRAIANNLPVAISYHDAQRRFLFMNRTMEEWFATTSEQAVGQPVDTLVSQDYLNAIAPIRARFDQGVRHFEVALPYPDGHTRIVDVSFVPENNDADNPGGFYTLAIDITARKQAEQSLEANMRQLRAITDNLPVAIGYQDEENRFRFVNRTLANWFGSTGDAMLGKTVGDFVTPAYFIAVEPVRQALAAGRTTVEVTLPFPDGKTRTVDSTMVMDRDEDGRIRGRYSMLIDVTERVAAEEQMRQSQKMQAIGKLTGGVAHDFNNLLAVIAGNLDLALERGGDERIVKLLEPARRAAERGSTLTKSLLAFARQQPLSPQVSDLNSLARDMTELLRRTLPSNIGIEFVGGAGLWKTEVDPGQLQNALLNLVVNARDAMPDGGRLTIETQNARIDADYAAAHDLTAGQYVLLAVSDTGIGMPAEVVARAFEPFYTTKGVGEGTGLGLSMVYGFARQSGGHVAIYSEVGSGTTVRVYLPRWISQEAATAPAAERATPLAHNETVLVVEDDTDMRFIAVTMLQSLGYTVLEAPTGAKALDVLDANPSVALLVTDVVLAGSMNGRRLAEEALTANPQLKVLFMSGYTEDAIVHHGRLEQGVHFIQKPFRKPDLAAKAREALDSPAH